MIHVKVSLEGESSNSSSLFIGKIDLVEMQARDNNVILKHDP